MTDGDLEKLLVGIRAQEGFSKFDRIAKKILRQKLQVNPDERHKRIKFKHSDYESLYRKQNGICPECDKSMVLIKGKYQDLDIDHINPNEPDFNARWNLRLTHASCNRAKGGKSIAQQAKESSKTMKDILQGVSNG